MCLVSSFLKKKLVLCWSGKHGASRVFFRSSVCLLWLLLAWWVFFFFFFVRTPNSASGCISNSFAFSWDYFSSIDWPCLASIWSLLQCLSVVCLLMLACCLLDASAFLKGNRDRVDLEQRGGGGRARRSGRRENCGPDNCIREEYVFLKK